MPRYQSSLISLTSTVWVLALASPLGFAIVGFFLGDPINYTAFGLLPAAALANVAILASYLLPHRFLRRARNIWIAFASIVLMLGVIMIQFVSTDDNLEATDFIFSYIVRTLSFPASLLSAYLPYGLAGLVENSVLSELIGDNRVGYGIYAALDWSPLLVIGYLQWFLILPYAVRKLAPFWERRRDGT